MSCSSGHFLSLSLSDAFGNEVRIVDIDSKAREVVGLLMDGSTCETSGNLQHMQNPSMNKLCMLLLTLIPPAPPSSEELLLRFGGPPQSDMNTYGKMSHIRFLKLSVKFSDIFPRKWKARNE